MTALFGEKRIENALARFLIHAAARIRDRKQGVSIIGSARNVNLAFLSRLADGLLGIENQLKHELKQRVAIPHDPNRFLRAIVGHGDII